MTPKDVKVPKQYQGGAKEKAYRAGYVNGYESKALNTIGTGIALETMTEIAEHGLKRLMSIDGVAGVVDRFSDRVKKYTRVAEQLDDAAKSTGKE